MLRRILACLAVVLYVGACCAGIHGPSHSIIPALEDDTVALQRDNDGEWQNYCAGEWISPTEFITASHCVETAGMDELTEAIHQLAPDLVVWSPIGQEIRYANHSDVVLGVKIPRKGKIVAFDPDDDLALVSASGGTHSFAPVAIEDPAPGDEIHVEGHPVGLLAWTYKHGFVSKYRDDLIFRGHRVARLQLDVEIHPGNSGGGAFNTRGELVGICSFSVHNYPDLGFFVGADLVRPFLKSYYTKQLTHKGKGE
jgi:hypothetical protein